MAGASKFGGTENGADCSKCGGTVAVLFKTRNGTSLITSSACPIFVATGNSRCPAQYVGIGHWDGEKIILGAGTEIVENGSIGIGLKNVVLSFWRTRTHILTVSVT